MKISRAIEHGSVVAWRGDKLILAGKSRKNPVGVFNLESTIRGFDLNGERFSFNIPGGVRTWGEAEVRKAKDALLS